MNWEYHISFQSTYYYKGFFFTSSDMPCFTDYFVLPMLQIPLSCSHSLSLPSFFHMFKGYALWITYNWSNFIESHDLCFSNEAFITFNVITNTNLYNVVAGFVWVFTSVTLTSTKTEHFHSAVSSLAPYPKPSPPNPNAADTLLFLKPILPTQDNM